MEAIRVLLVDDDERLDTALANAPSAPNIINPSPTRDVATGPLPPVCDQNLQLVVEQVGDQLRQLTLQRQEIAQRIAIIKRTINGLALLYGGELQPKPEDGATAKARPGITNACRVLLNRAETPLRAREVYAILQGEFPDFFRQPGNHYASLVTILNRLVKYGEIDTFLQNGSRFWQRRPQSDTR